MLKGVVVLNRLKELRAERNMKQSDLAKLLNLSSSAVSNYETNYREIDAPTIRTLCGIFDCTADYLLGISDLRTTELTVEEQELVAAWRRTPKEIRNIIDAALAPYRKGATMSTTA